MARTTYFRASLILVATMAALVAMLLVTQKPARAGLVIGGPGICISGPQICPPETTITSGPSQDETVYTDSVSFSFSSNESPSTFECKLDNGVFERCTSPQPYTGLSDGSHTFQVRATDPQGDVDASPESRTWRVDTTQPPPPDTTPPETRLSSCCQPDFSKNTTATFNFTGSDDRTAVADLEFECRLDGISNGSWLPCTSPKEYPGLSDGSHTFEVRAIDAADNADPTPASRQFTIDTSPPETTITSHPPDPSGATPAFGFSGSDNVRSFWCRYYPSSGSGGNWSFCTSPYSLPGLTTSGTYTFEVFATDKADNFDTSPASYTWTVDATAPSAPVISSPNEGSYYADGSFTVTGTAEAGSTVELFEGPASRARAQADPSGQWSLVLTGEAEGSHSYKARATDALGNVSGESEARTVIVDATAPAAPSILSPVEGGYDNDGSFTVSGIAEPDTTVKLSEGSASKGTTKSDGAGNWSLVLTGEAEGPHAYTATAADAAGNVSAESGARTVIVDATRPTVERVVPAENATGIAPGANVTALFSEATRAPSINARTFKLYKKGSTTALVATVTYDPTTRRAVLNPSANLQRGATYKAVVSTGVRDLAGNQLGQQKVWSFRIRT